MASHTKRWNKTNHETNDKSVSLRAVYFLHSHTAFSTNDGY